MRHEAQDTRYLPIFMVFELSSRRVSTPYLRLSNRQVTSNLRVREATVCTRQNLSNSNLMSAWVTFLLKGLEIQSLKPCDILQT